MGRKLHLWKKSERGQALVEIALVLPLLLLLLFGIVEFGRVGHAYLTLNYAAREGARLGITGVSDEDIIARIDSAASSLREEALSISLSPSFLQRESGEEFRVTLDYQIFLYMPLADIVFPNPLPLRGEVVMRME